MAVGRSAWRMARKLRWEYAGACYHAINRGNYRKDLFAVKGAAESFEACLFEASERAGWRLHAFVIMRNHFHLAVETPEPNLSEGMRWLQATWAARFNRYRGEVGRPFQGRYKALHVEAGHALAQVAHYIHLNPVRAGVVPGERAGEFRWSSLHWFPQRGRPACLEPSTVLAEAGHLADTAAGWRCYRDYLDVLAEEAGVRREEKLTRLSQGWALGTEGFKAGLREQLRAGRDGRGRFELLGADPAALKEARAGLWEEKLVALAEAFGVSLEALLPARSAAAKVQLAAAMKRCTSVSNAWLAARLQMGQPASVSQYVRRFRLGGGEGEAGFGRAMSRVKP